MSSCYSDYEYPQFYNETNVKARKKHLCSECHGVIPQGETYTRISGKWDNYVASYKHCSKCRSLVEFMKAHVKCFDWCFTQLIDHAYHTVTGAGPDYDVLKFPVYRHVVRQRKNWKAYKNAKE